MAQSHLCHTITHQLLALGSDEKRLVLSRFFKTAPGQYGHGDRFMGVAVPLTRQVALRHADAPLADVQALLMSEWHEARLCALLIMVAQMGRAGSSEAEQIYQMYLANTPRINNWDLVDLSAPQIVGAHLMHRPRHMLYHLADSALLWDNRIAMVATLAFIRQGQLDDTFALAQRLMGHPHELMHKAVGWMLREAGKRDMPRLRAFVDAHWASMPRTMLRYAIEKYPDAERRAVLTRGKGHA